jgi:hypothetical protein
VVVLGCVDDNLKGALHCAIISNIMLYIHAFNRAYVFRSIINAQLRLHCALFIKLSIREKSGVNATLACAAEYRLPCGTIQQPAGVKASRRLLHLRSFRHNFIFLNQYLIDLSRIMLYFVPHRIMLYFVPHFSVKVNLGPRSELSSKIVHLIQVSTHSPQNCLPCAIYLERANAAGCP